VLNQVIASKALFISRLRYRLNWYDPHSGAPINWKDVLPRKGSAAAVADKRVVIGKDEQLPVRIILIPLPARQAAARIRRAKQDRDKRLNHGADYYRWLRYDVFITNVEQDTLSATQVADVYGIRWQIEVLFKSWKSGGHLQSALHQGCTNVCRVKTIIYLLLVFYSLVVQRVYVRYWRSIENSHGKCLSILKVLSFVCDNLLKVISASADKLKQILARYCCYDQRKDRVNMMEFIYQI